MANLQRIKATEARNNFFSLLNQSYFKKQSFIVEKGGIPMVYIISVNEDLPKGRKKLSRAEKNLRLLVRMEKFQKKMKVTSDSVLLLREMRRYGR